MDKSIEAPIIYDGEVESVEAKSATMTPDDVIRECILRAEGDKSLTTKYVAKEFRERGQQSFEFFVQAVVDGFVMTKFHSYLCGICESIYETLHGEGDYFRTDINTPPQHGKSVMMSQYFPAWLLGKNPKLNIVDAAYSIDLARRNSKATLKIMKSPKYQAIFPDVQLEAKRSDEWRTSEDGGYKAVGVGGGLTGQKADLIVIDDPVKNSEEAASKVVREKIWDWYESVAKTRLSNHGCICLIMTRWNTADLAGKLTSEEYKAAQESVAPIEIYKSFEFPAECENPATDLLGRKQGEFLTPERYSNEHYLGNKYTVIDGERVLSGKWCALWQQKPVPDGGNLLSRKQIVVLDMENVPFNLKKCRAWDLAASTKTRNDFSVGAKCAYDRLSKRFIILDIKRKKLGGADMLGAISNQAAIDGGYNVPVILEGQGGFKAYVDLVKKALNGRALIKSVSVSKDKVTRAAPWLALAEEKRLCVVKGVWNNEFFDELESFPEGAHDDIIDAISLAYSYLVGGMSMMWTTRGGLR